MTPEEFKKTRRECGKTQKETADMLGVNQSQISRWERGLQPIPAIVDRLVECLRREK